MCPPLIYGMHPLEEGAPIDQQFLFIHLHFAFKTKTEFRQQANGFCICRDGSGLYHGILFSCKSQYFAAGFIRISITAELRQESKTNIEMFQVTAFEK